MRSGGGPDKGSAWERELCVMFSLWISRGEHKDLFERNVSSGGAFTSAARRGTKRGVPGDLMSVHPLSHQFLQRFFVEAKFWKDLYLDRALWNPEENLCRVIRDAEKKACESDRLFLLVAKQNRRHPLLMMSHGVGAGTFGAELKGLQFHLLWDGSIFVCRLDHALRADPEAIMRRAERN